MSEPRTINLPGSGVDTQSYELAPGLLQYVQAVYVTVDNSAGGDARPTLTLSEQSGVVIAKKRQGESVAAGDTGSATWALRLTDEVAAAQSDIFTAHVRLFPSDFVGNLSKTLAAGRAGAVCWPEELLFAASPDANPAWTVNQPQVLVESGGASWSWVTWNGIGAGTGGYFTSENYITSGDFTAPWANTINGEGMRATAIPNDLTTWTTGHVDVYAVVRFAQRTP